MKPEDCLVVLHDADELTQPDRTLYQKIKLTCAAYPGVIHIVAKDEIESWLLADDGLCKRLEIKPRNWDEVSKPKAELKRLLDKQRINYPSPTVYKELNGTGDQFSPSMRQAFKQLRERGCLESP
jgi:hypothetical protein